MANKHSKQTHKKTKTHAAQPEAAEHISDVENQNTETPLQEPVHQSTSPESNEEVFTEEVKVEFPYSNLVRAYVPKAMDVADKVATDWKKDGSFMNLGIENPYANMAVSMGLKKAKEIEKKLDEKGVLSAVRMGVEVIKQQVNKKK